MSYAIIRNEKYKRENLKGIYRHNERRNKNYSNKNIDSEKTYLNYSIKSSQYSYEKEFEKMKEKYNLKGQIKTVSNIACEYIITSDKEFFDNIGAEETKRYFETAYKFVCDYKNLGEQYIMSANVHMDEETPHMHLVFIPVVHTTDKKRNSIDKIACSEFWKEKDSYRMLQDAFYEYMTSNNFELQRGDSDRTHLSVEDYKKITNFENNKTVLRDIKLELPETPDVKSFGKLVRNRDEKIQELVVEPRNKMIKEQQEQISLLYLTLQNQVNIVESNYSVKLTEEMQKVENKYEDKIYELENENNFLKKVISTLEKTVDKFIHWVCKKFSVSEEDELIRDFEYETDTYIDPEKQIEYEEELEYEEMEW